MPEWDRVCRVVLQLRQARTQSEELHGQVEVPGVRKGRTQRRPSFWGEGVHNTPIPDGSRKSETRKEGASSKVPRDAPQEKESTAREKTGEDGEGRTDETRDAAANQHHSRDQELRAGTSRSA